MLPLSTVMAKRPSVRNNNQPNCRIEAALIHQVWLPDNLNNRDGLGFSGAIFFLSVFTVDNQSGGCVMPVRLGCRMGHICSVACRCTLPFVLSLRIFPDRLGGTYAIRAKIKALCRFFEFRHNAIVIFCLFEWGAEFWGATGSVLYHADYANALVAVATHVIFE